MREKGTKQMASKIENPFSMRFVLPEQRELYLQAKQVEKLVSMPILEQDEFESFQYIKRDAAREDYAVTVSWWNQIKGNLGNHMYDVGSGQVDRSEYKAY
ncbi:YolD-like family protein [Brevibacillus fortis]|uniref:YolD-like family protein n=1 Tax=Brevibacillus fortis TaxID=2126352 RepID=UPI0038FCF8F9